MAIQLVLPEYCAIAHLGVQQLLEWEFQSIRKIATQFFALMCKANRENLPIWLDYIDLVLISDLNGGDASDEDA
jgi:hypothetical protein